MARVYKTLAGVLLITACLLPAVAVAAATTAATAVATTAATAATRVRHCDSADLRYPFMPGGPRTFGVFQLRIAGGKCPTAHRIAQEWMRRFEASFRGAGPLRVPRLVEGFTFKTLPISEVQAFPERGQNGATTIWFDYRIPNG